MRSLVPCASCNRHVESEASACPFCGAVLTPQPDLRACAGPCAGHVYPRLGRVAVATVGAALLCASCYRGAGVKYGLPAILDSGRGDVVGQSDVRPPDDGGEPDGPIDSGDAAK
jgi:hypothetical protein